jgi:antitoxin (DNA-binding transcriptional repressor) of toxin-antitoxin stability system
MKASILDIRRRMRDVLAALDRNEPVTITYRGKDRGVLYPAGAGKRKAGSITEHRAFGMWKDRKDLEDVDAFVRSLRKSRHAL